MKLTFQQEDDVDQQRAARSERLSGFSRARAQLSQAVGGALLSSLGALGGRRAQSALPAATPASALHGQRLREVLERDRALVASLPPPAPNEPASAPAEQDDWMELRAAQDRVDQETSGIRARSQAPAASPTGLGTPAAYEEHASTLETYAEESIEPDEWMAHEARAIEVLAPRGDAIAQAIADAIADEDDDDDDEEDEDTREMVPIQLDPLVASTAGARGTDARSSTAATVVMATPVQIALCKEPIRTRTMAKLLAAQGHRERALSIYEHLLREDQDETLKAEANALRAT